MPWQKLRGAWTDHCFPAPFSWFLHETGLECLKITSPRCFSLKCQRKDSKKVKEHRQFRGVLGRWRTAAIDHTTCHACQRCRKTAVFAVFPRLLGCYLARKSLWWPAMLVSNKKQEFAQRKRIKLFDDFWLRTDSIFPRGAGLEHRRWKQSIFSLSIFGILVERLSF